MKQTFYGETTVEYLQCGQLCYVNVLGIVLKIFEFMQKKLMKEYFNLMAVLG